MEELEKLLKGYMDTRLRYPQEKRVAEEKLMTAIVDEIINLHIGFGTMEWAGDGLGKPVKRGPGRPPKRETA